MNFNTCEVFLEFVKISRFKKLLKKSAQLDFNRYWKNYSGAKHTKNLFPDFVKLKFCYPYLSRKSEKLYFRMSFTQNFLNVFLFKINKCDTDLCRFCNKHVETGKHIFCDCHFWIILN